MSEKMLIVGLIFCMLLIPATLFSIPATKQIAVAGNDPSSSKDWDVGGGYRDKAFSYKGEYLATLEEISLFHGDPNKIIIRKIAVNASLTPSDICPYPWTNYLWQPYENGSIRCDIITYGKLTHLKAWSEHSEPFAIYIDGQLYANVTDGSFNEDLYSFTGHIDYWGIVNKATGEVKHFDYDIWCECDGALEFCTTTGQPIKIFYEVTGLATYWWVANYRDTGSYCEGT